MTNLLEFVISNIDLLDRLCKCLHPYDLIRLKCVFRNIDISHSNIESSLNNIDEDDLYLSLFKRYKSYLIDIENKNLGHYNMDMLKRYLLFCRTILIKKNEYLEMVKREYFIELDINKFTKIVREEYLKHFYYVFQDDLKSIVIGKIGKKFRFTFSCRGYSEAISASGHDVDKLLVILIFFNNKFEIKRFNSLFHNKLVNTFFLFPNWHDRDFANRKDYRRFAEEISTQLSYIDSDFANYEKGIKANRNIRFLIDIPIITFINENKQYILTINVVEKTIQMTGI